MHGRSNLLEEMGDAAGLSQNAVALCCAIVEDAELAREFELEPCGALELICVAVLGKSHAPADPPLPRELTDLIA